MLPLQFQRNTWLFSPVPLYLAGIFKYMSKESKLPPNVRAMDMHPILLILLSLLEGLLTNQVEENNTKKPVMWIVEPSPMMVDITIMLLSTLLSKGFCKGWGGYQGLGLPWNAVSACMFNILCILSVKSLHINRNYAARLGSDSSVLLNGRRKHICRRSIEWG